MSNIKSVTMRFDLSDPVEAETYALLKETGEKACRPARARQARYLLSVLLEARNYQGVRSTGLNEWPTFIGAQVDEMEARLDNICAMLKLPQKRKRPELRLV